MIPNGFSSILRPFIVVALFFSLWAWAQTGFQFGQNKVQYKDFDWEIFRTEHFDVHYYPEEEKAARDAARMAERGYDYLSEILKHQIKNRIPLILYASLNDFQQTNVVNGLIGQGTRGVTESLKNRVVLPITGSYRQFNHVLVHELVHAFQFDMMANTENAARRFSPPLWLVEGMAEYLSAGMDNVTRMWMRDGLLNDDLVTIAELNNTFDIRVYRLGQSVWHYIGETYGKQKVGDIFKSAIQMGSVDEALKANIGINSEELSGAWHQYAREIAVPENDQLKTLAQTAEKITHQESFYHRMNLVPAVSPDGQNVVFIANKNLRDEIYMLSEKENGEVKQKKLIKGGSSNQFEALRYFDTAINWSRDGQRIAFISKSGKHDAIYIMNPHNEEITRKIVFEELNGLLSPTFSPDGNRIAFIGMVGGISDLYIVDLKTEQLIRRTDDRYAVLHPQWSPDGKSIAYVTDRGAETEKRKLLFDDYDLGLYHVDSNEIEMITNLDGNVSSPQWSPDGSDIVFVSDHQGIPNIYRIQLTDGRITQVTSLRNGVSGITETTPALSWSADGSVLVFSAFQKRGWHLFKIDMTETESQMAIGDRAASPVDESLAQSSEPEIAEGVEVIAEKRADSLWLPSIEDANTVYANYKLEEDDSVKSRDYSSKLRLDAVGVGANIGGFFGSVGAAQFLFSDMLGNQNLLISTGLRFRDFLHSDVGVTYFNQGNRFNYGLQAYQQSSAFSAFASFNSIGFLRNTYRGFNAVAAYPFSKFARVELFSGVTWVEQDLLVDSFDGREFDRETNDIGTFNYVQAGAALVFDNTVYGPLGPNSGSRSRFSVTATANDFQFTNFFADHRRYFNISPRTVLAWRLLGGASIGKDEQIFRLGGAYSYRGADFGELIGPNFFVSNLEYRFPFLPFLPANYDFLSAAAFWDVGAAWGIDVPGFVSEEFQPFTSDNGFRLKDLQSAFGIGARLNIGYFLLQYDLAFPTDLQGFNKPVNLFSIGTYF